MRNTQKQKILLQQNKRILRTSDLAVLWEIDNKNTLHTTIKRFKQKGILYPIYKGLYSTIPLAKLDKYELGCAVAGPLSYISTETVLQNEGIIMQNVDKITLLGQKNREITINSVTYLCRRLNPKYLINRKGIYDQTKYSIASLERAVADILYINPKYYFDNNLSIDDKKVSDINSSLGYKEK